MLVKRQITSSSCHEFLKNQMQFYNVDQKDVEFHFQRCPQANARDMSITSDRDFAAHTASYSITSTS